jgi:NADH dehydrogenase FAD-containing subunit
MKIEADIHFWCIGKPLRNTWIEESDFFEYVRDGEGRLKVDANLQLLNMSNVFAAGDITDIQVSFIHHNMLSGYFS